MLLITANRTVRNRYERPSISDLVYQLGRLFVEQENTGQHRGSGPVFGVKLKWTSAGLQNQKLQVRGLALRPFFWSHGCGEAVSFDLLPGGYGCCGERHGAGLAKALTCRVHDGRAPLQSQIHESSSCSLRGSEAAGAFSCSARPCRRAWSPTYRSSSARSRIAAAGAWLHPRFRRRRRNIRRSCRRGP